MLCRKIVSEHEGVRNANQSVSQSVNRSIGQVNRSVSVQSRRFSKVTSFPGIVEAEH